MDYPTKMTILVFLGAALLVSLFCFVRLRMLGREYINNPIAKKKRLIKIYTMLMFLIGICLFILTVFVIMKMKLRT